MATDVESEGNEKTRLIQDSEEEEEKEKEKSSHLSVEEYKRLHNIGSRLSTENVITYKESAFLHLNTDSAYHSVTGSRSQEKINDSTNVLNSADQLFDYVKLGNSSDKFKASVSKSPKKSDKNVKTESDKDSPGKEATKEKVKKLNSGSVDKNEGGAEKSPSKANKSSPKQRKRKKSEPTPMPGRRVRREASLNAMAMVNILFEKEPPVPKSSKKRRSSTQTDISAEEKEGPTPPKAIKKTKNVEKKIEKALKKKKDLMKITLPKNKGKDKKKILKVKSLLLNKKMLKLKAKKKLEKAKKAMNSKKGSDKNSLDSKSSKKRQDTKKSARTHEIVIPKRKRCCSGSTCATCFQPLSCQHQNSLYWNSKEMPHSENIPRSNSNSDAEDVKPCINMDITSSGYSLSHLQHIDSASYVNSIVQHPTMPSHRCPQCAQAAGLMPSCPTYALGSMGSLGSMNLPAVIPYPAAYGGSYPLPYPGSSTLPHCTCPQCLYYSQSNTNISHQPLPARDHCILSHPPISIQHIEDKHVEDPDSKVADEIIDVGIEEFPVVPQSEVIKTNSPEKVRKNSSGSKVGKIKSKSSEKEICNPKKKLKCDSQKKSSSTESKVKSPKIPRERKKSTSKKEAKVQRTIFLHGWNLHGPMEKKKIFSYSLGTSFDTECFQAIKHLDGDIIQVRDCVILRSGPKKTDIPFVAKVTQFWKHPQDGDVMMSLLWYYHPEHTEGGRKSQHASCELFASKHRDENSVACIDDKGYVLTYNEYCRFRAERLRKETDQLPRSMVVPAVDYQRSSRLPADDADPSSVFLCRQVYDFKLKRILKNPS